MAENKEKTTSEDTLEDIVEENENCLDKEESEEKECECERGEQEISDYESAYNTLKAEYDKMQNYAMRTKADLENIKKRNENIASDMYLEGKLDTLAKVLPVMDSVDRALAIEMPEAIKDGLEKIKKQFDSVLEKLGVEEIKAEGEVFDPNMHNALMQVDDEANSGKVVNVYEKGYKYKDKILRHASVVVAK